MVERRFGISAARDLESRERLALSLDDSREE